MQAGFMKNTNEVIYILSDKFRYDLLILEDAGPGYAKNMEWEYDYLKNISSYLGKAVVAIDNRIEVDECNFLLRL
jgi:hypothetical protein